MLYTILSSDTKGRHVSSSEGIVPIVVSGSSLPMEAVRSNPALTKQSYFSNFAGGYLVGTSVASHPQGEECGAHNHRGVVEQFVVFGGAGVIELDGDRHTVRVGDCVVALAGVTHNLIGTSPEPFQVLCTSVVAPGHEDDKTPWLPR